jgi:hypothetical protein
VTQLIDQEIVLDILLVDCHGDDGGLVSALAPKRPAFSSAWQPTRDGSYFS